MLVVHALPFPLSLPCLVTLPLQIPILFLTRVTGATAAVLLMEPVSWRLVGIRS